jgi:class 3 adenylate cyclase
VEPRIQYAKTSDGADIAYTLFGEGPPLVLPPSITASHLQKEWEMPVRRTAYERLADRATVVRYDPRGLGMSRYHTHDFSFEAATLDLEAVTEAAGLDRFALYVRIQMGDFPMAYAARYPERVTHLILYRLRQAGTKVAQQMNFISSFAVEEWELFTNIFARLATDWDSPDATPLAALVRESTTPEAFLAAYKIVDSRDPFVFAPEIRAPTMLLHPIGDEEAAQTARELAAAIASAHVVGVPGEPMVGQGLYPNAAGVDMIHDFIGSPAGRAPASEHDTGAFRSILFTDIIEHTRMMERLGDEAGRDVLRDHERIIRRALREHGGAEIKTIGDSFMASFSSAQRAIECAIELQRTFALTDVHGERVRIRAGINAGEPITEGDDLFGSSVILAARAKDSAGEGEIVVTDVVRQLVTGKGFHFAERGAVELRGFEEPVRLWEVHWREVE